MLDTRLMTCVDYVQGNFLCDVGTDHGHLPVHLIKCGKIRKAIACDIREKPLEAAGQNIRKAGLSDQIRTILSDGLQEIPGEDLTDIVIAGMGGETIIHILDTCPWCLEHKNLIFQPMTKQELLRKWLSENGFMIREETCVRDRHFLYAVMRAEWTGISVIPGEQEIYFGKMNLSDPDGHAYAEHVLKQLRKARDGRQNDELSEIIKKLEGII